MPRIALLLLWFLPNALTAQNGQKADSFQTSYHELALLRDNGLVQISETAPHRYANKLYFTRMAGLHGPGRIFTQIDNSQPVPFELKPADETQHIGYSAMTNTGQRIYYMLYRTDPSGHITKSQIWFNDREFQGKWGPAKQLPRSFVENGKNVLHPATGILRESRTEVLFFVSERMGGKGKLDLWCSFVEKDGSFSAPLQFPYNSEEDEAAPFFDVANQVLYFSSKGHRSYGGYDVFRSHYLGNGKWTAPENLGRPVNSPFDDLFFTYNETGHHCYFSSNRPTPNCRNAETGCRSFNLYNLNLAATLQVFLFDDDTKLPLTGCHVELKDVASDKILTTHLNLVENFATVGLQPGKQYQLIISKPGYRPEFEDITCEGMDFFKTAFLELRLPSLKSTKGKLLAAQVEKPADQPTTALPTFQPSVPKEEDNPVIVAYTEPPKPIEKMPEPPTPIHQETMPELPGEKMEDTTPEPTAIGDAKTKEGVSIALEESKPIEEKMAETPVSPVPIMEEQTAKESPTDQTVVAEKSTEVAPVVPPVETATEKTASSETSNPTVVATPEEARPVEKAAPQMTRIQAFANAVQASDPDNFLPVANMPQIYLGKNEDPIDLLFFHKTLKCQVALDVKEQEYRHFATQTMERYLTAIDGLLKTGQEAPLGITFFIGVEGRQVVYSYRDKDVPGGGFVHSMTRPLGMEGVLPSPEVLLNAGK